MKRKSDLFQLIRSLSKSEKRFFKVFSSRHVLGDQNNYIALFDAIERQADYDEKAIQEQFAGEKMLNRFSVAKAYLYDLILKAMSVYHSQNSLDNQIDELLRRASFLYEKCLFGQAEILIGKAKKLALDNEKFAILPEILRREKRLMEAGLYVNHTQDEIETLHRQNADVLEKLDNLNEYWLLDAKLYHHHNTHGMARSSDDVQQIAYVFDSNLMRNEDRARSFDAQLLFQRIYATYFFILRDFESCYNRIRRTVELLESQPELADARPLTYISSINNLLNMTQVMKKQDETEHYLRELERRLHERPRRESERYRLKIFEAYYHHQLSYYLEQGRSDEALPLLPKIEEGLARFGPLLDATGEIMLCYNVFLVAFWAGEHRAALKWIERITCRNAADVRPDIYYFAHVLRLMTSLRQPPTSRTDSILEETKQFLSQREAANEFERKVETYVGRLPIADEATCQRMLIEIQETLHSLSLDPFERKALAYFDFKRWAETVSANRV